MDQNKFKQFHEIYRTLQLHDLSATDGRTINAASGVLITADVFFIADTTYRLLNQ